MPVTRDHADRVQISIGSPHAGVVVTRFACDGHLLRAVPDRFSTALHLKGRSEWSAGRTRWSSRPGTTSLKVPGEVYAERAREGRGEFQVVLFDAALVDEARRALDRPVIAPQIHALDRDDPRGRALAALHQRCLDDDDSPIEAAVCEGLTAFVELTCAARGTSRATGSAAVARARALLDERITETVGLDELAAHARLDKYRLCRAFRAEVGLPPHAYVTHRRVALAQGLLARGVGQAEVAARVGLYDQSQLHRHFKRILGLTPGAFARAAR